jgi:glycosyltransferase involved in cell wall biosynthesis
MRLLVCTDTYPPQINGVSVITSLTVEGLAPRGWECVVVAPSYAGHPRSAVHQLALPSVSWPLYPELRVSLPQRARVRRLVQRFQPDLIHCATEFVIGSLGLLEARRAGIPVCSSYHTDFSRYTTSYQVPWLKGPVERWIQWFHQRAQRTFTPSLAAQADLRNLGLSNVEVWGRGIDTATFTPTKASMELRRSLGTDDAFAFLHVGRLAPEKNIGVLLDAFARVRDQNPSRPVRLLIAGDGPAATSLRAQASPAVTFLGAVDRHTQLPALYASCDAFLYASTTETLGLVVLEAMASQLPVIATAAGGVAEHLVDGENGLAFAANDVTDCALAMQRLLDDAALRQRLQQGARATAESRSWESELDRLDASYRDIVFRGPGRSVAGASDNR